MPLPEYILQSKVLTAAQKEKLAASTIPEPDAAFYNFDYAQIVQYFSLNPAEMELEQHKLAAKLIDDDKLYDAWQVLL